MRHQRVKRRILMAIKDALTTEESEEGFGRCVTNGCTVGFSLASYFDLGHDEVAQAFKELYTEGRITTSSIWQFVGAL